MTVEEWDDLMRRGRIVFWILMACGHFVTRANTISERSRCLEVGNAVSVAACFDMVALGCER